jgi:histone-lysine N-methyltransferase SETD3
VAEAAEERDDTPPLRLIEPPQEDDPFPPEVLSLSLLAR